MLKKFTAEFTVTPNQIINHKKISFKAKGIWTYLNSKPQNWNFSVKGIATQTKDGEDGITSGMKELEKYRFLKRVPRKDDNGQWNGFDYHLTDTPFPLEPVRENPQTDESTVSGKTVNGKTVDGKSPTIVKNDLSKKDLSNKEKNPDPKNLTIDFPEMMDFPNAVLNYLNEIRDSKIGFSSTASNLSDIKARIREKFTMDDFKQVIDYKNAKWKNDPKMKKYIRPSTLFGSKFNEYLVESEGHTTSSDGSQNFKFNPTQKADLK